MTKQEYSDAVLNILVKVSEGKEAVSVISPHENVQELYDMVLDDIQSLARNKISDLTQRFFDPTGAE